MTAEHIIKTFGNFAILVIGIIVGIIVKIVIGIYKSITRR